MAQPPKKRDENAKSKRWQVPVNLESVTPEDYPREFRRRERPTGDKGSRNKGGNP